MLGLHNGRFQDFSCHIEECLRLFLWHTARHEFNQLKLDGIQRLISTYSKHHWPGGGGGGVQGKVRFGLRGEIGVWKFLGGCSGKGSDLDSGRKIGVWKFFLRGVFWERSDLDSGEKIGVWNSVLGGMAVLSSQNSKCQDPAKFQISGGGGGVFWTKFQNRVFCPIEHKICLATFWKHLHHR